MRECSKCDHSHILVFVVYVIGTGHQGNHDGAVFGRHGNAVLMHLNATQHAQEQEVVRASQGIATATVHLTLDTAKSSEPSSSTGHFCRCSRKASLYGPSTCRAFLVVVVVDGQEVMSHEKDTGSDVKRCYRMASWHGVENKLRGHNEQ